MSLRIGFYICHCGINIGATVAVEDVAEYAATLPHVVVARDYMYMCSDPGQEIIDRKLVGDQRKDRGCRQCQLRCQDSRIDPEHRPRHHHDQAEWNDKLDDVVVGNPRRRNLKFIKRQVSINSGSRQGCDPCRWFADIPIRDREFRACCRRFLGDRE